MVNRVSPPPYLADSAWYSAWLKLRLGIFPAFESDGILPDAMAIMLADSITRTSSRSFARTVLTGNGTKTTLSVPVEGGRKAISSMTGITEAKISDHGNWSHVHIGTLEALYGRTPFFPYIFPSLRENIGNHPADLAELNTNLHLAVIKLMRVDSDSKASILRNTFGPLQRERGRELLLSVSPHTSILDCVMAFGPESVLPLLI